MSGSGTSNGAVHFCRTCCGPCRLTGSGAPMPQEDVREDLVLAQSRWHKARREGKYFRAEWWERFRDIALDHLEVS